MSVLLLVAASMTVPLSASAAGFSFVQCGTADTKPCQFQDLIFLIVRMINYLISVAAIVAIHRVLSIGFNMVIALGNPEKIKTAREGLEHALVGFAMVVLSFVFLNLLMNGLFGLGGKSAAVNRPWWDPKCIYLDTAGCPQGVLEERNINKPNK